MADDDYRLHEIFDALGRYSSDDPFEQFKNEFFRAGPAERVAVLTGWDQKMQYETKPSRETAELINRKMELDDLHSLLSRAGR
jgi:hypothetical protein